MRGRPERGPVYYIPRQPGYKLANVHASAASAAHSHDPNHVFDFVSDRLPRLGPIAAQELRDAELSGLAPEGPVMRERHVRSIVGQVSYGKISGPVGENVVLNLEHLAGHVGARHNDHVDEAHAEVEDATVFSGEVGEAVVC